MKIWNDNFVALQWGLPLKQDPNIRSKTKDESDCIKIEVSTNTIMNKIYRQMISWDI